MTIDNPNELHYRAVGEAILERQFHRSYGTSDSANNPSTPLTAVRPVRLLRIQAF
jgi:hypothetical protein